MRDGALAASDSPVHARPSGANVHLGRGNPVSDDPTPVTAAPVDAWPRTALARVGGSWWGRTRSRWRSWRWQIPTAHRPQMALLHCASSSHARSGVNRLSLRGTSDSACGSLWLPLLWKGERRASAAHRLARIVRGRSTSPRRGHVRAAARPRRPTSPSPATMPGFHAGRPPHNKGLRYRPIRPRSRRSSPSCAPPATVRMAAAYAP
jgi:hypothetical protein